MPGRAASARSGASTGSGSGGGGGGAVSPGGRSSRPWPPSRQAAGGVRPREVAQVAAAEDGDGATEPARRGAPGPRRCRRAAAPRRVGDDLGEGAVEVEEQRIGRAEAKVGEVAEAHAGTAVASSASRKLRRHQPMSCSRTERIMSCQRSTRSSIGIVRAR